MDQPKRTNSTMRFDGPRQRKWDAASKLKYEARRALIKEDAVAAIKDRASEKVAEDAKTTRLRALRLAKETAVADNADAAGSALSITDGTARAKQKAPRKSKSATTSNAGRKD